MYCHGHLGLLALLLTKIASQSEHQSPTHGLQNDAMSDDYNQDADIQTDDFAKSQLGFFEAPWIERRGTDWLYQFNRGENSWLFAREHCLAQGGDLVSIEDIREYNWLIENCPIHPDEHPESRVRFILIGLSRGYSPTKTWTWVTSNVTFMEALQPWVPDLPQVEDCAYLRVKGGHLADVNCDMRVLNPLVTRFVCKVTRQNLQFKLLGIEGENRLRILANLHHLRLCESDWLYYAGKCYHLIRKELSWQDAKARCVQKHAQLASVHNEEQRQALAAIRFRFAPTDMNVWFGGSDVEQEGAWKWADGSVWKFEAWTTYFGIVQPDDTKHEQNCLLMAQDGKFHDWVCETRKFAMCQKKYQLNFVGTALT